MTQWPTIKVRAQILADESILYHYTDARGLMGMVQTRELWATSIFHLNDASEFRHGCKLFGDLLQQSGAAGLWVGPTDFSNISRGLDSADPEVSFEWFSRGPFVASFSEFGDQLSQWRAYCPHGNGFAVGFRKSTLRRFRRKAGFRLLKCVYSDPERGPYLRQLQRFILRTQRFVDRSTPPFEGLGAAIRSLDRIAVGLTSLKDPGFAEECEWRLSGHGNEEAMGFRTGRFGVVPYFKLPLFDQDGLIPFARIYIGPGNEPGVAKAAVLDLLRSEFPHQVRPDMILISKTPYRY